MSGRRNEPARARRRQQLKQALSLTSVPKSEEEAAGVATSAAFNINNHFGWEVLQKSQIGDGTFPHLFRYYEKPDIYGREFDKVTYVLYMDKGTIVDKNTKLDGIQNTVSGVLITPRPSTHGDYHEPRVHRYEPRVHRYEPHEDPVPEPRVERVPWVREVEREKPKVFAQPEEHIMYMPDRRKKKKLISEFYKRDRSRSHSPGDRNKNVLFDAGGMWQASTPDVSKTYLPEINQKVSDLEEDTMQETERTALIKQAINKEKEEAGKNAKKVHYNINQLRAGAEKIEQELKRPKEKYEKTPPVVKQNNPEVVTNVQICKSGKYEIAEELLKTSSGTNQYLYVSAKKRHR